MDSADFVLDAGEHVALVGPNGAGKSTLVRALLGLHPISSGTLELDGRVANSKSSWRHIRSRTAWIPQRQGRSEFPLPGRELLMSSRDYGAAEAAAERLGVVDFLDRPLHTLSGGQLQRMFLARALGQVGAGAGLIVADEPSASLDFDGQETIADLLFEQRATILVVSHSRTLLSRCDRIIEIAAGRVRTEA